MNYRNDTTGAIETKASIIAQYPNTSFPKPVQDSDIESLGYKTIYPSVGPSTTKPYEFAQHDGIELVDGKWTYKWKKTTATDSEKANIDAEEAAAVRGSRTQALAESDWTQTRDLTLSNDADWKTYRQALRDIPTQSGFPHTITWPTKPS
tara:strand:- start:283 stop:732 length:450 start_codon:yes stop_codon:yes gene_type:complete